MNKPIKHVEEMLTKILSTSGASDDDVRTFVFMLCEQNYLGNKFSGFSKTQIQTVMKHLKDSAGKKSELVVDKPSMKLINGNGRSAWLIGMEMVDMVSGMATTQGIGIVGLYNTTYHDILETYTRKIAEKDLIGIVVANGGPAGVTPFGGSAPIFGTNPISYAFPSVDHPIVFDGATAELAYGTIRLAKAKGGTLKEQTYLDADGKFTTDPMKAIAIIPFGGGYKGYAINLMIEIMTGIMVRAKSGLHVKDETDLGSLFIAMDPSAFVPIDQFKKEVSELARDIRAVKPLPGFSPIRVPGDKSSESKRTMMEEGNIYIDEAEWQEFEKLFQSIT